MADEINLSFTSSVVKNGVTIGASASVTAGDMVGTGKSANTQAVGTSPEAVDLGDVNAPRAIFFKNNDSTNFVQIDPVNPLTSPAAIKLLAGEFAFIQTAQPTWYAQADTAPVELEVVAWE